MQYQNGNYFIAFCTARIHECTTMMIMMILHHYMETVLWRVCLQIAPFYSIWFILKCQPDRCFPTKAILGVRIDWRKMKRIWTLLANGEWYAYCSRNQCLFVSMRCRWMKGTCQPKTVQQHNWKIFFSFPVISSFSSLNNVFEAFASTVSKTKNDHMCLMTMFSMDRLVCNDRSIVERANRSFQSIVLIRKL